MTFRSLQRRAVRADLLIVGGTVGGTVKHCIGTAGRLVQRTAVAVHC